MLTRARTAIALGLGSVARVATYRALLRAGLHPVQRIRVVATATGPFFHPITRTARRPASNELADPLLQFGWFSPSRSESPPEWHSSPMLGTSVARAREPWWRLPDFDPALGDIKTVWEASRFDWVVTFAQRASQGDTASSAALEGWLKDWVAQNQPFRGPNWKCGQEASIRVLHLAVAALILEQVRAAEVGIAALVETHLRRIAPTLSYARGQDNNHGTSEAAALFVGGSWLSALGRPEGDAWAERGRAALEERAQALFLPDGTFSQYSVNYQRLAMDTYSCAEVWRRALALEPFSGAMISRLAAATEWLGALVDPTNGDAPNLGHNDGANLLRLTEAAYRDFRPAVQLAGALFSNRNWYAGEGPWSRQLRWLSVEPATQQQRPRRSVRFDDGGIAVLHRGAVTAVLRYPRRRFRPAHADPLHLDLWVAGTACLRDGGSFSYAEEPELGASLSGIEGHNTVQFDGRQPMPRLGRFLWGDWIRADREAEFRERREEGRMAAAYRDAFGSHHRRRVVLRDDALCVTDSVEQFEQFAVLRWRLRPGAWRLDGDTVTDGAHRLRVWSRTTSARLRLVEGWESLHYLQRTRVPVLEATMDASGIIESEYRWLE